MKDVHSDMIVLGSIGPVSLSTDNTPAAIDLAGYDGVEIVAGLGIAGVTLSGTDHIVFELSHSDDNVIYSAVTDDDILGAEDSVVEGTSNYGVLKDFDAPHAAATTHRWGYVGAKRFLKLLVNFIGTHGSATPVFAAVLGRHPHVSPTPDAG